jgi:hypothetical protein
MLRRPLLFFLPATKPRSTEADFRQVLGLAPNEDFGEGSIGAVRPLLGEKNVKYWGKKPTNAG